MILPRHILDGSIPLSKLDPTTIGGNQAITNLTWSGDIGTWVGDIPFGRTFAQNPTVIGGITFSEPTGYYAGGLYFIKHNKSKIYEVRIWRSGGGASNHVYRFNWLAF
jgi:hypothetical protein